MTNYINGRAREYRIMNKLKEKGWVVCRTAGSHSPIDLIAINPKDIKIIFIQCKPKSMSNKAKERLEKEHAWLNNEFICNFKVVSLEKELGLC